MLIDELETEHTDEEQRRPQLLPPAPTAFDGAEIEPTTRLRTLGIFTPRELKAEVQKSEKQPFMIEGLLRPQSINFLVGDSGLGKTPLAIQFGLCVASGKPLFGRAVTRARVLYCDAESGAREFSQTLDAISSHLGIQYDADNFGVWSPHWEEHSSRPTGADFLGDALLDRVRKSEASFVVVDSLRPFWPAAEGKSHDAATTLNSWRGFKGVTWLILHHLRKVNNAVAAPDLAKEPHAWFQEAAGSRSLINQCDTRLGVEHHTGQADLLMGGFVRSSGPLAVMDLGRVHDEYGEPMAYRLLKGVENLNPDDRLLYNGLPNRFRHKDVFSQMSNSGSNTRRFLSKCLSLDVLKREGVEYVKAQRVEGVEGVEDTTAPAFPHMSSSTNSTHSTLAAPDAQMAASNEISDGRDERS